MKNLFLQILDMSVSASVLAAVVIVIRLLLKKAPKAIHCALWAMVALRLVCPSLPESQASAMPKIHPMSELVEVHSEESPVTQPQPPAQVPQAPLPEASVPTTPAPEKGVDWVKILSVVWVSGVAVMAMYGFGSYLFLRRKVAPAVKEEGIWLCDNVSSPFILGIFRPRIYLPSGLEREYRDSVLAHERAHLRRKDHWWKPLGFALLAVHWFNPVMWLSYILLCRDIEAACDERVVKTLEPQERKAYSEALLSCASPRHSIAACPLAFGEQGVKGRIKSVLSYKKPTVWIILAALIASAAVGVFFLTDPSAADDEAATSTEFGLAGNVEAIHFTKYYGFAGGPGAYYEKFGVFVTKQEMDELCQMIVGKEWYPVLADDSLETMHRVPIVYFNTTERITIFSSRWDVDTQYYTLTEQGCIMKNVGGVLYQAVLTEEEQSKISVLREKATEIGSGNILYHWYDVATVYFQLFDEPVVTGLPNEQKISYYSAEVKDQEQDILQGLAGDRNWQDPALMSNIGAWKGAVNIVAEGKWTILTLYSGGIMTHKGFSPFTQEEKELMDALVERAELSQEAENYFTDDWLVYQQKTKQ